MKPLENSDLQSILELSRPSFKFLSHRTWLLTGCTGFFGKWLTQTLNAAYDAGLSQHKLVLLTRNKELALKSNPWLAGRSEIKWVVGDVRAALPTSIEFDGIVHGATSASAALNELHPLEMYDVIVDGTRSILQEARKRNIRDFMFLSSGGIYGSQPYELTHVPEDYAGASNPLTPGSSYGIGKRTAEFLCANWAHESGSRVLFARFFGFVGPYLPLDIHFAIGNFMRDALLNKNIEIKGDGTPYRSFLYGTDLTVWLLKILTHGRSLVPYHIGSEVDLQLKDLARIVIQIKKDALGGPDLNVHIAQPPSSSKKPPRYVPSTSFTRKELDLKETVSLEEAIRRTLVWHSNSHSYNS